MKTQRENTAVKECTVCGLSFMTVGVIPIELAQHRPPHKDINGEPQKGTCPRHKSGHS